MGGWGRWVGGGKGSGYVCGGRGKGGEGVWGGKGGGCVFVGVKRMGSTWWLFC